MSETDNDKPKLGMRQPLGLKRTVETGKVKQSFSHGRSNTVIVETKRRRVLGPQGGAPRRPPRADPGSGSGRPAAPVAPPRPVPSNETAQERQARLLREAEEQRLAMQEEIVAARTPSVSSAPRTSVPGPRNAPAPRRKPQRPPPHLRPSRLRPRNRLPSLSPKRLPRRKRPPRRPFRCSRACSARSSVR